ncbi:hypothetical protein GTS_56140 [Gandjariella thermophila]|uniref:PqqD family protein n=1 Tax=Gandjariella thermophila TaxID=1931992 RepID=A0A4D4JBE9_9PSEU|nr:hypothetical protein GTS_56140 [Gandjariella thermophila]
MNYTVLGKGPHAVRVRFRPGGVELRVHGSLISGNQDMARALRWVLNHREASADDIAELGESVTLEDICRLLTDLAPHGVPLSAWGNWWSRECARRAEVVQ